MVEASPKLLKIFIETILLDITNEKNKLVASMLGIAYDKGQNIE